jgi:hypothetical protein
MDTSSWFRRIKSGIERQILAARLPGQNHVVPTAGFIAASTGSRPNWSRRRYNSVVSCRLPSMQRIITSSIWRRIRMGIAG